ncbi:SNARE associated Golgi protein [Alkaliphilus metalliredigens QYMF]|uniref:TVP38/TMEM64 family membrane protein n=1 Tax=Alkaliphilus metalliredigens (strain QYMF) TaxID=293826 RepID=A6TNR3_ALKMQ|nr:VTT domain-containing protein [Alkaliphilus metalliredigens]ABR47831.1 SNARE associated Golgi protein [Alkaliphilus metalliredigens QYMF]
MSKGSKVLKIALTVVLFMLLIFINKHTPNFNKEQLVNYFQQFNDTKNLEFIFVGTTVVASVLLVPISWFKAIASISFGAEKGFVYALLCANISCAISFLIGRLLGRKAIMGFYKRVFEHRLSEKQKEYFEKSQNLSFTYIFLLRNIYFIPFSLTNYYLGVTNVSFRKYMLASFLGMIPGTFIYTYFIAKSVSITENIMELVFPALLVIAYYALVHICRKKFEERSLSELMN